MDNITIELKKQIIEAITKKSYYRILTIEKHLFYLEDGYDEIIIYKIYKLFNSLTKMAELMNQEYIKSITSSCKVLLNIYKNFDIQPDLAIIELLHRSLDLLKESIKILKNKSSQAKTEKKIKFLISEIKLATLKLSTQIVDKAHTYKQKNRKANIFKNIIPGIINDKK